MNEWRLINGPFDKTRVPNTRENPTPLRRLIISNLEYDNVLLIKAQPRVVQHGTKVERKERMRRDTGEIISESEAKALNALHPGLAVPMELPPTANQTKRGKVSRNDPCPCGSGQKFKKCCLLRSKK